MAITLLSLGTPALALSPESCTRQMGKNLSSIKTSLGQAKLISSTAASQYVPAMQMYKFGNYSSGSCMILIQNGKAASATYSGN